MKKKSRAGMKGDLRPEYDLKKLLKGGVRGKYARLYRTGANVVLLDHDVSKAFPNEQAVNDALRLVIKLTKISNSRKSSAVKAH
jgi:hypothetical protein